MAKAGANPPLSRWVSLTACVRRAAANRALKYPDKYTMKLYSHLPDVINLPTGETLRPYVGGDSVPEVIVTCKKLGAKYRRIRVLANNLRGKTDLHGKQYTGSYWVFTNLDDL